MVGAIAIDCKYHYLKTNGALKMLAMSVALLLVAVLVGVIVVMTPDNNSACTGNCRQGRDCNCVNNEKY